MKRYILFDGSKSCHCCFQYTIMDSTKPDIIGNEHYEQDGVKHYKTVCETFDKKDAKLILNALNFFEENNIASCQPKAGNFIGSCSNDIFKRK